MQLEKISVGTICQCDDTLVVSQIEEFLQKLPGCKVIYFTRNREHKLYIIDSERAKQIAGGGHE